MEEIKLRHAVITDCLTKPEPWKPILRPRLAYELCYLQLRMICELVALGCLIAHGEIDEVRSGRLQKAYAADLIVNRLERLHPQFYPRPGKQVVKDGKVMEVKNITSGYLTKADLIKLYAKCGEVLHRGSLKKVLSANPPARSSEEITYWAQRITTLLGHHQIALINLDYELWVYMQDQKDGKAHGFIMKRVGPIPTDPVSA